MTDKNNSKSIKVREENNKEIIEDIKRSIGTIPTPIIKQITSSINIGRHLATFSTISDLIIKTIEEIIL